MNLLRPILPLFINALTQTAPFLIYKSPLRTQNPLSVITSFTELHSALVIQIMSPTILILGLVLN